MAKDKREGEGSATKLITDVEQEIAAIRDRIGRIDGAPAAAPRARQLPERPAARVVDPRPINLGAQDPRRPKAAGPRKSLAERLAEVKPED